MRNLKSLPKAFQRIASNSFKELQAFSVELLNYSVKALHLSFIRFETGKGAFVTVLYRQRGKYARRFMHVGMAGLASVGMMIAPIIAEEFPGRSVNPWEIPSPSSAVLSAATTNVDTTTQVSEKMRDKILSYTVQDGETVSTIADKFGISTDTIKWQNNLGARDTIKIGQVLEILPVTGVSHKVQKGDTVFSIAKKYDTSPQAIVDFPYNSFVNDETFELAIGQLIIVPEGVKPEERQTAPRTRQEVPAAGTAVASGSFVWPTSGKITQNFSWYHKAIDIANRAAPDVLAADGGTIVTAGWSNVGYGYHIVIDHGNGFRTLYAHLQKIYQYSGAVGRGQAIGQMGNSGRSTGTHLHFEVTKGGTYLSPLSVLK